MARYNLCDELGNLTNTIVLDDLNAWPVPEGYHLVELPEPELPPAPSAVPQSVTRFQARAALHLAGLLESVETLMQAPETDMLAKLAWQDALEFRRNSPTVLAMAQALGLTDAQIDELFTTAAGIEA